MSTDKYTSADRLHKILERLVGAYNINHDYSPKSAFELIFKISSDQETLFLHFIETINLVKLLKNMCTSFGGRMATAYAKDMDNIHKAVASLTLTSGRARLTKFVAILSDTNAMDGLEKLAAHIADTGLEREIDMQDLATIEEDLADLIGTVQNANLDTNFKNMLLAELNCLLVSVQEYEFFGSTPIQEALQRTTGKVILHAQQIEQTAESIDITKRVFSKMRDINTIVSFTAITQQALPIAGEVISRLMG